MFNKIIELIDREINNKKFKNENLILLYWNIGKLIFENRFNSKDYINLEMFLQSRYGIVIGFSRRNLHNMTNFYEKYSNEIYLKKITKINWKTHLILLKQKDYCNNLDKINDEILINSNKKRNSEDNKCSYYMPDEMFNEFLRINNKFNSR